jgi:hypothetical protein
MGIQAITNENATMIFRPIGANNGEPVTVLIKFVRALATRQAHIDAGLNLIAANDNEPRTLH